MRETRHPRHRALSIASVLFLILGVITILVGIFGIATVFLTYRNPTFQAIGTGGIVLATFIVAVVLFALSNVIDVILDMYEHVHDIWRAEGYGARPARPEAYATPGEASPGRSEHEPEEQPEDRATG